MAALAGDGRKRCERDEHAEPRPPAPALRCAVTPLDAALQELRNAASRLHVLPRDMFDFYMTQRYLAAQNVPGATHVRTRATPLRIARVIEDARSRAFCLLPDGDLCVASMGRMVEKRAAPATIRRFSPAGVEMCAFPIVGAWWPSGVCLTARGRLAVVCEDEACVRVYTLHGELVASIGSRRGSPGQLAKPGGIALDLDGNLVVCDTPNQRLVIYTETGSLMRVVRTGGASQWKLGSVCYPRNVAVFPGAEHYYVADLFTYRIRVATRDGALADAWFDGAQRRFRYPTNVCMDSENTVFVLDAAKHRVWVLTERGDRLAELDFGEATRDDNPARCGGLAIDRAGRVFVGDGDRNRILVFE